MRLFVIMVCLFFMKFLGYGQNEQITESSSLPIKEKSIPSIYPNPSYGKLTVNLHKYPFDKFELVIKNIIGKKIWSQIIYSPEETMDMGFLAKGSYLMSIRNLAGETLQSMRLVIIDP